jgi:hypothetical protein
MVATAAVGKGESTAASGQDETSQNNAQIHLFVGSKAESLAPVQIQAFADLRWRRFLGKPVAMLSFPNRSSQPTAGLLV